MTEKTDVEDKEKAYEEAMSRARMPELRAMMLEQLRRFQEAARPFVAGNEDAFTVEPVWLRALDCASARLSEMVEGARSEAYTTMKDVDESAEDADAFRASTPLSVRIT